jgi:Raf kinase inhibitor-like YbhB/YbcL family protein
MVALSTFTLSSSAFTHGGYIPQKYTFEGDDINPPLHLQHIPKDTKSIVLIVDDPDAPKGVFDHWLVWNIMPIEMIIENSAPGIMGKNSLGNNRYNGPCPSSGIHKYFFTAYALDAKLDLPTESSRKILEKAMDGHVLASASLIGLFRRGISTI